MKEATKIRVRVWGVLFYVRYTCSQWGVLQYRLETIEGNPSTFAWGRTTFLAHESCGRFYGDFLKALSLAQRVQEKKLVPSPEVLSLRALILRTSMLSHKLRLLEARPRFRKPALRGIDGVQIAS